MTKWKQLGNPLSFLKVPVPPSEPTGFKSITKPFPSPSLGPITRFGQLGQFSNQNKYRYHQNSTLPDFRPLSKTLPTPRPKPVTLCPPLTNLRWKPNGIHILSCISFSVRGNVTKSTIIATIYCSDVGYCLFRNPLVTHIPYHVPFLLL